jgi:hypothetical protein
MRASARGGQAVIVFWHLLEAFTAMLGPVAELHAQFVSRRGGHDPRDTIALDRMRL